MRSAVTDARIPTAALALGLGGLIPFVVCGIAVAFGIRLPVIGDPTVALVAYGAAILSFLGGIRWGFALRMTDDGLQARELAISVLPSIAAWLLLLAPPVTALAIMPLLFVMLGIADRGMVRHGAPGWFATLRMLLTTIVTIVLLVAATGLALR
jgi:hypothetical protein